MKLSIRPRTTSSSDGLFSTEPINGFDGRPQNDRRLNRGSVTPAQLSSTAAKYESALMRLSGELARVKEHERQKLAEHLHDQFGPDLIVAKLKLRLLSNSLPATFGAEVKGLTDLLDRLIHRTRIAIGELCPQRLLESGFEAALQSLAQELEEGHRLRYVLNVKPLPVLHEELQRVLFQGVRELLFNVVKHASASRVRIAVTCKANRVAVEVCDNGRGFFPGKPSLSGLSIGRFGLFSVRARLAVHGGGLRIISRPGKGTRAVITLPLDTPAGV
jgi:signal transduction histidine kinase